MNRSTAQDTGGRDQAGLIELVVLAPKSRMARCRELHTGNELLLRSAEVCEMSPAEIVTVRPAKRWRYAGREHMTGEVVDRRLDVPALGLEPLALEEVGEWDPAEEYWGEEGEPPPAWAQPIIAFGPRPSFEMEQVVPGADPDDWESDPIIEASELNASGERAVAEEILLDELTADLRCLDAHAHLGNFVFDDNPERALRHYEAGVRIGELSFGESFGGCLLWGFVDNRPFLRCLHGFGLCLWRLGREDEAAQVFERMLWLNPGDEQGIRVLLPEVRAHQPWRKHG